MPDWSRPDFDWDDGNALHIIAAHDVYPDEAEQVFYNGAYVRRVGKRYRVRLSHDILDRSVHSVLARKEHEGTWLTFVGEQAELVAAAHALAAPCIRRGADNLVPLNSIQIPQEGLRRSEGRFEEARVTHLGEVVLVGGQLHRELRERLVFVLDGQRLAAQPHDRRLLD
jgi:hypothetical protein